MSSKRHSTAPSLPKPPTTIDPSAIIPDNASLTGTYPITIAPNVVIHPRAKLVSTHGPISIGAYTIICERSTVGPAPSSGDEVKEVVIEDHVNIEPGTVVEAARVGRASCIEVNARVLDGAVLGKHCKIAPLCSVQAGEVLPDFTVVYGYGKRRVDRAGVEALKMDATERHVELLRKLIPSKLEKWQTSR